jgi:hypothetical protein
MQPFFVKRDESRYVDYCAHRTLPEWSLWLLALGGAGEKRAEEFFFVLGCLWIFNHATTLSI